MAVQFKLQISKMADFAKASNFIYKVTEREKLNSEETENVCFMQIYPDSTAEIGRIVCNNVLKNQSGFQTIRQPERVMNLNPKTRIIFTLCINGENFKEVVSYQNIFLLLQCYRNQEIYVLITGSSDFYYKISQYLIFSVEYCDLRNQIFYKDLNEQNIKRLQEKSVKLSTAFFPLMVINEKTIQHLRDKCSAQMGEKAFEIIKKSGLKGKRLSDAVTWKEFGGVLKILADGSRNLLDIEDRFLVNLFQETDVLTMIFLAYLIRGMAQTEEHRAKKENENKRKIREKELTGYVELMQQYANACYQLLENIIFHSDAGWGILSVRIHKFDEEADNGYLHENYGIEVRETGYFEVSIRDFAGGRQTTDIASNFKMNLPEEDREVFAEVTPQKFFRNSWTGDNPWDQIYRKPEYIGKHFGLRIFRRILLENNGIFWAESHRVHECREEDTCGIGAERRTGKFVMPGTGYDMLFPLSRTKEKTAEDAAQEYGDWLSAQPERLMNLKSYLCQELIDGQPDYSSEKEKNEKIALIVDRILTVGKKEKEKVFAADLAEKDDGYAEILAKGVVIAEYFMKEKRHMVFYNCTAQFRKLFSTAMLEMFEAGLENMFQGEDFQIMLISEDNFQTVFVPGSAELTNGLNAYICKIRGERCEAEIHGAKSVKTMDNIAENYIPFDAIVCTKGGDTCFECYVREILNKDIQKEQFGCQITDTHMRLGSTIHIGQFYEAELLFGNLFFVSRFALLILREIYPELEANKEITLYGYGIYSESLLVEIRNAVRHMKKDVDIDYIFLEREEERREFSHTDRICYSRMFRNPQERKEYVRNRKYILIVPINSTLKTHQRLRDLLQEENSLEGDGWILRNYALILVGSNCDNSYWEIDGKYLKCKYSIEPRPRFFVEVATDYQEPLRCEKCFPEDVMEEHPLIEVNAASTIPNQAFGIVDEKADIHAAIAHTEELIRQESEKMAEMKDCLLYGHLERNDEHYLFYLSTDQLVRSSEEKIRKSLSNWKNNLKTGEYEYHILVAPMHYSNCTFVELVNDIVFDSMAMILRIDFNKDFRTNVYTKYSNIRQYIRRLENIDAEVTVNFHFVDDSIITGRTYHRAKSLIETMTGFHHRASDKVEIRIFDRIFTLVDRNSRETRMQYIAQSATGEDVLDKHYYTYIRLEISSLRNYGDSCVICNLYREAKLLCSTASTRIVSEYWKKGDEKFGLIPIEEALRRKRIRIADGTDEEYQRRAYRRMFCSHMLKCALDRADHGNQIGNIICLILHVLNADYHLRPEEEKVEYFISYLKVCSRPFLVFTKEVREAIFDILLAISEFVVKDRNISECVSSLGKKYWDDQNILAEWRRIVGDVLRKLDRKEKTDLVMVCMKQLTEMKSNYIIRLENMEALFKFMKNNLGEDPNALKDFEYRYIILIKRLTGISSDTSKGLWLDYALLNGKEMQSDKKYKFEEVSKDFLQTVILENSRVFRDGIQKLNMKLRNDMAARQTLDEYIASLCEKEFENLCYFNFFMEAKEKQKFESVGQLKSYLLENASPTCWLSPEKVIHVFSGWKTSGKSLDEYWKCCLSGLDKNSKRNKLQELAGTLKNVYDDYIKNNYQFENFRKLWEEMKLWEDGEENIQLTCALQIKYLCHSKKGREAGMLGKVARLARLAGALLNYSPHQVLIEYEDASEYYLSEAERVCLEKTTGHEPINYDCAKIKERFRKKGRRHYCSLVEKIGISDAMNDAIHDKLNDGEVLFRINEFGFYYGEGVFIWKLGEGSSYPIFFFVRLVNDDRKMKYRIRNLLQFRDELENYIFDSGKPDYFHELGIIYNRLNIYKNPKSLTHNSEENMEKIFRKVLAELSSESEQQESAAPVETLLLLAGMYLGRLYRQSVTKELYRNYGTGIKYYDFMWGNKNNIFLDKFSLPAKTGEMPVMIKRWEPDIDHVEFMDFAGETRLDDHDCLLARSNSCHEFLSLLLSLFLNAKKEGRGIAEEADGAVEVYLSKTKDGMLRVTHRNHCEDTTLRQIERSLNRQPDNENSGITLWSLNSYLKRELVNVASICLNKVNNTDKMESALQKIDRILDPGREFRIIPGARGNILWYELPFLWEKYCRVIEDQII